MERYALKFVEKSEECWSAEQLRVAEAQIEEQKKNWEMKRMAAMSGNDNDECFDAITGEPDSNGLLTYSDAVNQVKKKKPGRPRTKSNLSQSAAVVGPVVTPSSKQSSPVKGNSGKRRSGRKQHQVATSNDSLECFSTKEPLHITSVSIESEDRPESSTPDFSSRKRTRLSTRSEPVTPDLETLVADESQSQIVSSSNSVTSRALSPRTRSRGAVKINLWSLDAKPHLPGSSPKALPNRVKSEDCSPSPELGSNGVDLESVVTAVPTKKFRLNELETDPDLDVVS